MIRNKALWEAWEKDYIRREPVDFHRNLALMEAMYEEARAFGVFPLADPWEGLESRFKLAKALNVPIAPPNHRIRP